MKALILLATAMPLFGQCEDAVYRGEGVSVRLRAVGGRLRQDYTLTVTGGAAGPAYAVGLHEYPDTAGVSCRYRMLPVLDRCGADGRCGDEQAFVVDALLVGPACDAPGVGDFDARPAVYMRVVDIDEFSAHAAQYDTDEIAMIRRIAEQVRVVGATTGRRPTVWYWVFIPSAVRAFDWPRDRPDVARGLAPGVQHPIWANGGAQVASWGLMVEE